MSILNLLDQLESEPSKNAKIEILKNISQSEEGSLFEKVVAATYNPLIKYHIKEFNYPGYFSGDVSLSEAIDWIGENLATRKITGNDARDKLSHQMCHLTEEDAIVLGRIIKHDLRAGFTSNTAAKVWKSLQFKHPYMRGSAFSEKLLEKQSFPCYTQLKSDGLYSDTIVMDSAVRAHTRSGKELVINQPERDAALMAEANANGEFVLMGEVLVRDEDDSIMSRQASNGYMNRDDRDESRIFISAWDMVPLSDWGYKGKSTVTYSERFARLEKFVASNPGLGIELTEHRVCNNVQDIVDHFKDVRERGEEGLMLKSPSLGWKDGTATDMIKLKVVIEVEMRVTGWTEGTGKFTGMIGSIECASECGEIVVNASGLIDEDRTGFLSLIDDWIANGQVITIKTNGVTLSKTEGAKYSLYLPRFKEVRQDKNVADTLAKIQQQEAAFTDCLKLIGK